MRLSRQTALTLLPLRLTKQEHRISRNKHFSSTKNAVNHENQYCCPASFARHWLASCRPSGLWCGQHALRRHYVLRRTRWLHVVLRWIRMLRYSVYLHSRKIVPTYPSQFAWSGTVALELIDYSSRSAESSEGVKPSRLDVRDAVSFQRRQ